MARPKGSKSNPNRKRILTQSEIQRTVKAVRKMDLPIHRVDAYPETGRVSVITSPTGEAVTVDLNEANPWDKVLRKKDAED
jgi:hypothetical protein